MNVNDLVNQVAKYNTDLAKDIRRYLSNRKYGLVYEESKPEFVRLPTKKVVEGDLVNILPPRGTQEKDLDDDSTYNGQEKWRVLSVDNNKAKISSLERKSEKIVNYDSLISIARFDQPIYTGLREVDRIEQGKDKAFNVVINGENFHALETMMYAYRNTVDCIY